LALFNKFNFDTLTKAFNKIITIQVVVVVVVAIVLEFWNTIDKVVYSIGQGNMLTSIIVSTAMITLLLRFFLYFKNDSFELNQFDIYEKTMHFPNYQLNKP
jgi:multisubunit Na+/H+ antiporter MnhC subunit